MTSQIILCIDLARTKSEGFVSLISIVYTNKIYNRVILSGDANENSQEISVGLIRRKKNNFARAAHFLVHFFAVVLHDYNEKLPETS